MLFNSLSFLFFFPLVVILYYVVPKSWRLALLLVASIYFYAAFVPTYILVLFSLIAIDYTMGLAIERSTGRRRFVMLCVSLVANIGALVVFKYLGFFEMNLNALASFLRWNYSLTIISLVLPLGLSFHVFQSLSYVIEVYSRRYTAERNLWVYALYVMFFPQLVAGPIERPAHLLPQLHAEHSFDERSVIQGLECMAWGFFKKMVIADTIAPIVDKLYGASATLDGPSVALLAVLFSFQIYCDFSGYSDIAVGAARVLGISLTENFNRPYAARSISDFWRRWHMSLSSWFRDYVYIPLGGNRKGTARTACNLFITFLLSGLWHGAGWPFVIWGAYHGSLVAFHNLTKALRQSVAGRLGLASTQRLYIALQIVVTYALVCVGWLIFRAADLSQAESLIIRLGTHWERVASVAYIRYQLLTDANLGVSKIVFFGVCGAILLMQAAEHIQAKKGAVHIGDIIPAAWRPASRYALIAVILCIGSFGARTFWMPHQTPTQISSAYWCFLCTYSPACQALHAESYCMAAMQIIAFFVAGLLASSALCQFFSRTIAYAFDPENAPSFIARGFCLWAKSQENVLARASSAERTVLFAPLFPCDLNSPEAQAIA